MVNMEILNDAELLENLKRRFLRDFFMTYVGPTLLVVNPFKLIPYVVSIETRTKYIRNVVFSKGNPNAYKEIEPHVYGIAA